MAYRKDVWHFPGSNEYEYKFIGNYGAKGEKRHKRQKATQEQIRKQNQRNKEKRAMDTEPLGKTCIRTRGRCSRLVIRDTKEMR